MDCSIPGFHVLHNLLEFAQTHDVHCISDAIQHLILCCPFSSHPQSFPASGSFPVSWFFASGGQCIVASASASVLPMNIQGWFPLGWTGLTPLQSKGLSRVFSCTQLEFVFKQVSSPLLHGDSCEQYLVKHFADWPFKSVRTYRQNVEVVSIAFHHDSGVSWLFPSVFKWQRDSA